MLPGHGPAEENSDAPRVSVAFWFSAIGHGRALEAYLGALKVMIGLSFAFTDLAGLVPATSDLTWSFPREAIAAPFLVIGALQLLDVVLNIRGYEGSWRIRAAGATLAMAMWIGLLSKTWLLAEPSLIVPLALTSLPFSMFLFWKAINRLPVPGTRGLI